MNVIRSFNWKKSLLLGVGLLFVSCCALGAIVNKNKPVTSAKEQIPVATATTEMPTAEVTKDIPTQTTEPTVQPTEIVEPTVVVPTATTVVTEESSATQPKATSSGDSYPCADGQIKGNINSNKYHVPGGQFYTKTVDNVVCFDTVQEAEKAKFVRSKK
jgi:hypothetical protein